MKMQKQKRIIEEVYVGLQYNSSQVFNVKSIRKFGSYYLSDYVDLDIFSAPYSGTLDTEPRGATGKIFARLRMVTLGRVHYKVVAEFKTSEELEAFMKKFALSAPKILVAMLNHRNKRG
jgi:hypothetical protein